MKIRFDFKRPAALGPNFNQGRTPKIQTSRFAIPALGIALALFFGLAAAVLPWQFLIGIVGLPLLLLMGIAFPLPVFGVSLLLMFGIVPEFIMAALPLGGASLRPPELILIFLFLVICVKANEAGVEIIHALRPIKTLLALLALGLVIGLVKGKLLSHNILALADARQFVGWLALPIAVWFARTRPAAMQNLVIGIALLAAILMLAQLVSGVRLIYGFRGAEYLSKEFNDVTRSAIGGGLFFLSYAAYILFLKTCNDDKHRWWSLLACIIVIGGIVASFNRGVWAGFALSALILLLIKPKTKFGAAAPLSVLLLMVALGVAALLIAKPRVADALVSRIVSVREEGGQGSSLGFRFDENEQALKALKTSPIVGVGMGGEYKTAFRQLSTAGSFDIEDSYIHNGYLSLWLKLGAPGLLFPLVLAWTVVVRARRIADDPELKGNTSIRCQVAAVAATVAMMYVSALTSPDWTALGQCAALAILLALLLPAGEALKGSLRRPSLVINPTSSAR